MKTPPSKLGREGRRLWRSIWSDLDSAGAALRSDEIDHLEAACDAADKIARVDAELEHAELVVRGSRGQDIAAPLLTEYRQLLALKAQLLARLRLDLLDESTHERRRQIGRASARRGAANRVVPMR